MGSRLFRTLVGVGISLGATGTGCLGQSDDHEQSTAADPGDGGSGGSAMAPTQATSTTGTTGAGSSASEGATSEGATSGSVTSGAADTAGSGVTSGSGGSEGTNTSTTAGSGGSDVGGSGSDVGGSGSDVGGSGGAPGAAGQGGDGSDPFCDTTWPTTKGNPPIPECVDPDHECEDEFPLRCLIRVAEFACDGHFERSYAPLCVNGSWECEAGLVPVTECKCFTPLHEGYVCTEDGPFSPEGEHP